MPYLLFSRITILEFGLVVALVSILLGAVGVVAAL